jgi:antitoxin component HigA of HigAB toxin-antitoxin module
MTLAHTTTSFSFREGGGETLSLTYKPFCFIVPAIMKQLTLLKQAIKEKGLTQRGLARELGCHYMYINMVIQGRRRLSPQLAKQIAAKFKDVQGITIEYLLHL